MKLHVGCGKRYLKGYKHVDAIKYEHVDYQCDILTLSQTFEPNSIDEIYACHVLEHVGRHKIAECLEIFYKIIKPGGTLRLAVPDIEKVFKLYNSGVPLYPTLYGLLWGGQRNSFDYHFVGFDLKTLSVFLEEQGFVNIERYDWQTFLPSGFDDFSRCYLPNMDFDNGELMSLNVVALKQ